MGIALLRGCRCHYTVVNIDREEYDNSKHIFWMDFEGNPTIAEKIQLLELSAITGFYCITHLLDYTIAHCDIILGIQNFKSLCHLTMKMIKIIELEKSNK